MGKTKEQLYNAYDNYISLGFSVGYMVHDFRHADYVRTMMQDLYPSPLSGLGKRHMIVYAPKVRFIVYPMESSIQGFQGFIMVDHHVRERIISPVTFDREERKLQEIAHINKRFENTRLSQSQGTQYDL